MQQTSLAIVVLTAALTISCATQNGSTRGGYGQAQHRDAPGVNYCPERLPQAQRRIEELYSRVEGSRGETFEATVSGPYGEEISVTVSTSEGGDVLLDDVETGLSDLVFNCGASFSEQECFIEVYLDGERLADLGPTTEGQVPLRCLSAGRHNLRIESVATTIFDDVIWLESDKEHLAEVRENARGELEFEIYAVNSIPGRIPPVPTRQNTARDEVRYDRRDDDRYDDRRDRRDDDRWEDRRDDDRRDRRDDDRRDRRDDDRRDRRDDDRRDDDRRDRRDDDRRDDDRWEDRRDDDRRGRSRDDSRRGDRGHDRHAAPAAMAAADFQSLVDSVEGESFKDGKLRMVETAAAGNYFTADQVTQLVEQMTFGSAKVEVAVMLYPRIVDQNNFFKVLAALEFESHKREVKERLNL